MTMEPVRIKLYGLFRVTRRSYVIQLILAAFLLAGLLVTWYVFTETLRPDHDYKLPSGVERLMQLIGFLPWVVPILAVLFTIEAVVVFRAFARAEAARKESLAPSTSSEAKPADGTVSAGSG